jgi:hypothetical protein
VDWQSNLQTISFDWFILLLRIAFIGLIFIFLYQITRIMMRELVTLGVATNPATGTSMMSNSGTLEVIEPGSSPLLAGEEIPLAAHNTIGRSSANSLQVEDGFVSGSHAEILFRNGEWWLIDSGSRNGTFINTRQLPKTGRAKLAQGDVIQFGEAIFRFRL